LLIAPTAKDHAHDQNPRRLPDARRVANPGILADARGNPRPGILAGTRKPPTGGIKMRLFRSTKERTSPAADGAGEASLRANSSEDTELGITGYERLDDHEVVVELSKRSQLELGAIESFERSHRERPAVIDKLRYLRGPEPLPDYDALSTEDVVAAIDSADDATLGRMRVYERKFQRRPDVLGPVADALRARRPARTHRA